MRARGWPSGRWKGPALVLLAALAAAACGGDRDEARAGRDAAAAPVVDAVAVEPVPPRPLGFASPGDFFYLYRAGSEPFLAGRAAEQRGDGAAAESSYRAAIAADPAHLDAHWALAVALAQRGAFTEVSALLAVALAADWVRFGDRMLASVALAPFRASREGAVFLAWADAERADFERALREAVIVVGRGAPPVRHGEHGKVVVGHRAEIFALELGGGRWLRLTYTDGAVVGLVRSPDAPLAAYVRYRQLGVPAPDRSGVADAPYFREIRVGAVELASGTLRRETIFTDVASLRLGWATGGAGAAILVAEVRGRGARSAAAPTRYAIDLDSGAATPIPRARHIGAELVVDAVGRFGRVRAAQAAIDGIAADWDSTGGAGAFRLTASRRTVTLPAGELADVATMSWSPARTHLAFATLAPPPCGPAKTPRHLYVVDAATGRLRQVAEVDVDPSPSWVDDGRLIWAMRDGATTVVRVVDAASLAEVTRVAPPDGAATTRLPDLAPCAGSGAGAGAAEATELPLGVEAGDDEDDDDPLFDLAPVAPVGGEPPRSAPVMPPVLPPALASPPP